MPGALVSFLWLSRGGFRLRPTRVEFWEGQPSRLHDRFVYSIASGDTKGGFTCLQRFLEFGLANEQFSRQLASA